MNRTMDFTVFCIESYKQAHNLTGREAMKIFNKYNVFEYINSFYDILHSNGQDYIIQDIDVFIKSRERTTIQ